MTRVIIITETQDLKALNIPCKKVHVSSLPTNAGIVWLGVNAKAVSGYSFPLDIGLWIEFTLENINQLDFVFDTSGDRIAVLCES